LTSSGSEIDVNRAHSENVLVESGMVECEGEEDVSLDIDMEILLEEEGKLWVLFGMLFTSKCIPSFNDVYRV
jgi:hypothetical protein